MKKLIVNPGDTVVTNFFGYQHYSVVSDNIDKSGKYKLISPTNRTGTVKEEDWDLVTQGRETYVTDILSNYTVQQILISAKSQINTWSYSVINNNCEHFVKLVNGLEVTSTQVKFGITGAVAGFVLVKKFSEEPNFLKLLAGAIVVGGISVALTRAIEKTSSTQTLYQTN